MTGETPELTVRYAVRSDRGLVRDDNQDAAYAGARLFAVADGFGPEGHKAGRAAIDAIKPLESKPLAGELLNALEDAIADAGTAVSDLGDERAGTTLTALLWSGSRLALVHIGDSRAYLLRDGTLSAITSDHTYVRSLVEDGRLTEDEAVSHPQRALLLRALHPGAPAEPDLELREARAGDRYLLCSDGLHAVVSEPALGEVLATEDDPDRAVGRLVALAHDSGAPDNIACVVADITTA